MLLEPSWGLSNATWLELTLLGTDTQDSKVLTPIAAAAKEEKT